MSSSFIALFCSIYIDWCTVSYYLHLFACMCLRTTIDDTQFEGPQETNFEELPEQQFANEGNWSLIMSQPYKYYQYTFTLYACMCLEYDGSQVKDMPSFN
jgi:hypothetical protein